MADLVIRSGDGSSARVLLDKPRTVLGRSRDSDVFLPDQWLSRQHAEIRSEGGGFVLRDLNSKNGTLLNGVELQGTRVLQPGDVITLGEHVLTFEGDGDVAEPEPTGTRVFSVRELSQAAVKPSDASGRREPQNRLLQVLMQGLAQTLVQHQPLAEVFEHLLTLMLEAVPAERGAILLIEGEPPHPVIKASRSRQGAAITAVSTSIRRRVLAEHKAMLLPNLMEDDAFRQQDSILSSGIRSALCAPLSLFTSADGDPGSVIGLVYLDSRQRAHEFTEEDLVIITALANVAAAKIENARLLEESLEKRALEDDMRRAAEIQRRLLPDHAPQLPGWSIVGSNTPSRAVGGDYYDFLEHGDQLLFALGDVSGKGTGAALLMAVLRAAVRAHWTEAEPAEAVGRINRTVLQNIPEGKYVTFFMGRLDPATGALWYVNAGHLPPVLVRAGGAVEMLDHAGGMVLGMFDSITYTHGTAEVRPGDLLAVFSDGVTETWSPSGEEFGDLRVAETLAAAHQGDSETVQADLLRALDAFSAGARPTDDRTLLLLKRL
jgi:sigma-B regulation protein RsbU (phosphoserine phosphatase)